MDPNDRIYSWLTEGAPAGISMMPAASRIFPELHENEPEFFQDVYTDIESFTNCPGIDDDLVAIEEIDGRIQAGHLFATTSLTEAEAKLGVAGPILNKFGIISKIRAVKMKRCMVHGTKKSWIMMRTAKCQRVILPSLLDAVSQLLCLMTIALLHRCTN